MTTGTIKKVVADRGFGFIVADDAKEYFFHRDGLDSTPNFDRLMGGENLRQGIAQVLDPGLDLGIQVLPRRVDGVQVQLLQAVLGQHPYQAAITQTVDGRVDGQHANAHAAADRPSPPL